MVWWTPVAYQSAKLRQLVLARLFTSNLPQLWLMTPWQFIDCGMVEDHTPKCHQHQEKSVQQPLTKEFEVSRHACPSNQGWISNVDSLQQKTYPTAHSCNNFGIGFYVEC